MKNKKKILIAIWLVFLLSIFFILPAVQAASGVELPTTTGLSKVEIKVILTGLLKWLLEIVGIIAVIGFIISGIMYLVSTGNEEMITKAKKYMLYCLIGVVVVLASFVVIQAIDAILNATI
jgi:Na+-driven multidrug efflux pump